MKRKSADFSNVNPSEDPKDMQISYWQDYFGGGYKREPGYLTDLKLSESPSSSFPEEQSNKPWKSYESVSVYYPRVYTGIPTMHPFSDIPSIEPFLPYQTYTMNGQPFSWNPNPGIVHINFTEDIVCTIGYSNGNGVIILQNKKEPNAITISHLFEDADDLEEKFEEFLSHSDIQENDKTNIRFRFNIIKREMKKEEKEDIGKNEKGLNEMG